MSRLLERSLVVSTWADARDMATMARWMLQSGQATNKLTRSKIMAKSLSTLAAMIREQFPELAIDSIEQSYELLLELGLAGNSERERRAITTALEFEQASTHGNSLNRYEKLVTQSLHGERLDKHEFAKQRSQELDKLHQQPLANRGFSQLRTNDAPDLSLGLSKQPTASKWRSEQLELIEQMSLALQQQGYTQEDIEQRRQSALATLNEREQKFKQQQAEEQKERIAKASAILKEQRAQAPSDAVANTRETALAEIERQAEKRSMAGVLSKNEVEQWRQQQLDKVNKLYDSLEPQPQS